MCVYDMVYSTHLNTSLILPVCMIYIMRIRVHFFYIYIS